MTGLLELKDKLKAFYSRHEGYVQGVLKFIIVFIGMFLIKNNIGYMDKLQSATVIMAVSVLSAFLPMGLVILILAAIILANIYALSLQLVLVSLCIMLVMFILYYRFTPKESVLLVIIPMMFYLKIPYVVPIVVGLISTPVSIVAVAFGTIVYYMLYVISANAATINNMEADTSVSQIEYFITLLVENKQMYLTIVIFLVVLVVVYLIKRMSINNSWTTAIIAGGSIELVAFITGNLIILKSEQSVAGIVISCIISVLLSILLQFFVFSVDYSRTEHTQFEDDEYYYYVKAVPKINVAAPEMNVKRINAQRSRKRKK